MRDTIDMAREAGFIHWEQFPADYQNKLKAFEALVRADERDDILRMSYSQWFKSQTAYDEAIKARGNT